MLKKRNLLPVLLILIAVTSAIHAQEDSVDIYGLGDQTFSINAGAVLPLFIVGFDGTYTGGFTKLSVGASGSLRWGAFLNNETSIGADLGGMFAVTELNRTLIMLPVTGVYSYTLSFYPFELMFHVGLGVNFTKLDNDLYIGPVLKPGASFYWNYNGEWSFGLQTEYWFVPEFYFGDSVPVSHNAFGNFLGITLTTLYHFQ